MSRDRSHSSHSQRADGPDKPLVNGNGQEALQDLNLDSAKLLAEGTPSRPESEATPIDHNYGVSTLIRIGLSRQGLHAKTITHPSDTGRGPLTAEGIRPRKKHKTQLTRASLFIAYTVGTDSTHMQSQHTSGGTG